MIRFQNKIFLTFIKCSLYINFSFKIMIQWNILKHTFDVYLMFVLRYLFI